MPPALDRRAALQGAAAALVAPQTRGALAAPSRLRLRLIGTSDLHANIFAYDYYRDRPDDTRRPRQDRVADRGGARAKSTMRSCSTTATSSRARRSAIYVALAEGMKRGDVHPMIAAMNALGYAACALGNHEFNYGLDFLDGALARRELPVV